MARESTPGPDGGTDDAIGEAADGPTVDGGTERGPSRSRRNARGSAYRVRVVA